MCAFVFVGSGLTFPLPHRIDGRADHLAGRESHGRLCGNGRSGRSRRAGRRGRSVPAHHENPASPAAHPDPGPGGPCGHGPSRHADPFQGRHDDILPSFEILTSVIHQHFNSHFLHRTLVVVVHFSVEGRGSGSVLHSCLLCAVPWFFL